MTDYKGEAERLANLAHRFTYGDGADPVTGGALAAEAQVFAMLALAEATGQPAPAAAELTVYRASHESIVMGLYTTREAARAHCEADERATRRGGTDGLTFAWVPEDSDPHSPEELCVFAGLDDEDTTGYIVTPLAVASAYDPEAEA